MKKPTLNDLNPNSLLIAPSILAADFARLGEGVEAALNGGADVIHVDVMDGHFVPNLTVGPSILKSIRNNNTCCPYDVHLMIDEPEKFIEPFAKAGADNLTTHVELGNKVGDVIKMIHDHGCTAGVCLKPATPADALEPYLDDIELVLVMTVEPGFGGQDFMRDMVPKIRRVRQMVNASGHRVHVEVDGGITVDTTPLVTAAGANILVAGTAVFGEGYANVGKQIAGLRDTARLHAGKP